MPPRDRFARIVTSWQSPSTSANWGGMLTEKNRPLRTSFLMKLGLNAMYLNIDEIVFKSFSITS